MLLKGDEEGAHRPQSFTASANSPEMAMPKYAMVLLNSGAHFKHGCQRSVSNRSLRERKTRANLHDLLPHAPQVRLGESEVAMRVEPDAVHPADANKVA